MDLTWILICCGLIIALYIILFVTAHSLHREHPGEVVSTDDLPKLKSIGLVHKGETIDAF